MTLINGLTYHPNNTIKALGFPLRAERLSLRTQVRICRAHAPGCSANNNRRAIIKNTSLTLRAKAPRLNELKVLYNRDIIRGRGTPLYSFYCIGGSVHSYLNDKGGQEKKGPGNALASLHTSVSSNNPYSKGNKRSGISVCVHTNQAYAYVAKQHKAGFLKQVGSRKIMATANKRDSSYYTDKDKVVSITYEEIGLFPRSFSRVLDRFLKQLFSDVDNLVIQEYRFYRYLFLTTLKTIFILLFVPFLVNFIAKNYVVKPVTEYFWNTQHPEIFLNSYEQKRAFAELEKFEEKIYFETLVEYNTYTTLKEYNMDAPVDNRALNSTLKNKVGVSVPARVPPLNQDTDNKGGLEPRDSNGSSNNTGYNTPASIQNIPVSLSAVVVGTTTADPPELNSHWRHFVTPSIGLLESTTTAELPPHLPVILDKNGSVNNMGGHVPSLFNSFKYGPSLIMAQNKNDPSIRRDGKNLLVDDREGNGVLNATEQNERFQDDKNGRGDTLEADNIAIYNGRNQGSRVQLSKDVFKLYQEKTLELATYYNNHSIEAITNFFADLFSLCALLYLLVTLEIQINITKSFLAEVFFGLDDSKKSLLILLVTDLLVGYHSSNLWELFFQFIFNHYGIPESQTGIFLLVATLPVLLDVLFKYLIFRHLNRSSPATVATYQAIIE